MPVRRLIIFFISEGSPPRSQGGRGHHGQNTGELKKIPSLFDIEVRPPPKRPPQPQGPPHGHPQMPPGGPPVHGPGGPHPAGPHPGGPHPGGPHPGPGGPPGPGHGPGPGPGGPPPNMGMR